MDETWAFELKSPEVLGDAAIDMTVGQLIGTILRHERRTASYKLALIRSLNDLALGYPYLATHGRGAAIPLRRLAALWVGFYWPFVDPDQPIEQGRHAPGSQNISFRPTLSRLRALWDEVLVSVRPGDEHSVFAPPLARAARHSAWAYLAAGDAACRCVFGCRGTTLAGAGGDLWNSVVWRTT